MNRLEILKNSLDKKQNIANEMVQNHFDTVKLTNGQPLNDKRNGKSTLTKLDNQNESIRKMYNSIEKTKYAIEREEAKQKNISSCREDFPKEIVDRIESGILKQWGKHPNTLFVDGVEKGRMVWDKKKRVLAHRYAQQIPDKEQYGKFAKVYNELNKAVNNKEK